jgi:hypothetical protein
MSDTVDRPKNDGKIGLPSIDGAMNKTVPVTRKGGKGGNDEPTPGDRRRKRKKRKPLGKNDPPPLAENTDDGPLEDEGATPAEAKEPEPDSEAEADTKVLDRARKRMERCISFEAENRRAGLDDLKFKAGDQWPADVAAQRNFDKRPCLTINKLPTFIHQITNDQRQNRPAININPVGERGDPEAAKMYRGMIRQIERASAADLAYDTAFESAVSIGWGYWRVLTEYESPESFNQVIKINRIRNSFTVYLDPDCQEPDGADAKFGFISEMIPRDEFKELYPDADPMNWQQAGQGEAMKNWIDKDNIRIAEYFEIEQEPRTLIALSNGWEGWDDEISDEIADKIRSAEIEVVNERESFQPKVRWYKLTAVAVLEKNRWLGQTIPIVKVIGNEIDIEGKVKLSGVVRDAKDAQRIFNYWRTLFTEMVALQPKAPFIVEEGQIEGHETEWKQANVKNQPYLQYKGTSLNGRPIPPPQRQPFGGIPAGIAQGANDAAQDMMATTGIRFDATQNEKTIDESGKAIHNLRQMTDLGSFHYIDNLARALRRTGEILIDLIPKVYDTRRVLVILREDDSEELIQIDPTSEKGYKESRHPDTGKTLKIFNPSYGKYGCTVTIGPSYATKRIEAASNMMDFAKAMPQSAQLIMDLIAKNMDWPGAEEMARRLAKAIPPHLLAPDMKDVPPQVQAMLQSMQQQIKMLMMERMQMIKALTDKQGDRVIKQDKIDKDFEAKLLQIVQKVDAAFKKDVGGEIKQLGQGVEALMGELQKPEEPPPFEQAKQASDGKWYVPDPNSQGAWLEAVHG